MTLIERDETQLPKLNKKYKSNKILKMKYLRKVYHLFQRLDFKMAIKITFTAILSLYICMLLDLYFKHPDYLAAGLWCVVSSIVVLQANIGGTYKAIWNRFIGVLIGSAMGALFLFFFGATILSLGSAILVTILFCSLLGIQDSYRLASLSVAIIMIPWKSHSSVEPWIDAFFRFLDTCMGFVVAIFVSHVLWPSQAVTKMQLNMAETLKLFRQYFEYLLIPSGSFHKSHKISDSLQNEIDQALLQNLSILEESKVELMVRFSSVTMWVQLMNDQNRLWEILKTLKNIFNETLDQVFDEGLKQQVQHTVEVVDFALKELSLKLKKEHTSFDFDTLMNLHRSLQQELIRFRATHAMKRYNLDIVENYFVFFYQFKEILLIIYHFNQILDHVKNGKEKIVLNK